MANATGKLIRLPIAQPQLVSETQFDAEPLLQVGELAQKTGKTVRALHLYEELGLLRPHARSKGRYRLYGSDALTRVRWIHKLQDMGLSLAEITQLKQEWASSENAPKAMHKIQEVFETRLQQTKEQIRKLQILEKELHASLQYLSICHECNPIREIKECPTCDLHECDHQVPELVRGVQAGA